MKKQYLAAAIGAMLLSGTAMAVEVSHGGKGDVLIAPMIMTGGGWRSEMKVVNTDPLNSVVAKVVFHSPDNSIELLDFLILLSPGDVWVGELTNDGTNTRFTSTDDSAITVADGPRGTPAGACPVGTGTVGFDRNFSVPYTVAYANIFQTRLVTGLGLAPVSKAAILAKYSADCVAAASGTGPALVPNDTANVLTGSVKLSNAANGNMLGLPMTTLANYDNLNYHSVGAYTGFFNNVSASPKRTVEDALWANDFVVPYNNAGGQFTFATFTFPTKEAFNTTFNNSQYVPFGSGAGAPTVTYTVRNEQEVALTGQLPPVCTASPCPPIPPGTVVTLPNELNIVQIATGAGTTNTNTVFTDTFTKGWVNVAIQPTASRFAANPVVNSVGKLGAPAIGTVIQWNFVGNIIQGAWSYAAATSALTTAN